MAKRRLDVILTEQGVAASRAKASAVIMAGEVTVNGQVETKPGTLVPEDASISLRAGLPYVSRGGVKLAHALDSFAISVTGRVCLDVGASTGGFTDCLLQRGAARVYAVDVGYGQIAWSLRSDPRVVVMERTNIRYLERLPACTGPLGEQPDFASIDVSFISLRLVLPVVFRLTATSAGCVALVKPQFEAGRRQVGKGGVVRDPAIHRAVLDTAVEAAGAIGWRSRGLVRSPITGPAGNVEFLLYLSKTGDARVSAEQIASAVATGT